MTCRQGKYQGADGCLPWVMSGKSADDYNDRGDEHVRPEQQTIRVKDGIVSLPPHSITFLTIEP